MSEMSDTSEPRGWLAALDRVLRGDATNPSTLTPQGVQVPTLGLTVVSVALGILYGAGMGLFAAVNEGGPGGTQIFSSALKVPALFVLTLLVTFPSLYVFNALVGSRLGIGALLNLLVASMAVTLAVLASLGPIVAFFSVVSTSYAFIKLLNVAVFAVSGFLGLGFLLQTLHRLSGLDEAARLQATPTAAASGSDSEASEQSPAPQPAAAEAVVDPEADPGGGSSGAPPRVAGGPLGALDRSGDQPLSKQVKLVFRCWVVLFGLVGAQMAWVLRPFIGSPHTPFAWFRPRESNFFEAVFRALAELIAGGG